MGLSPGCGPRSTATASKRPIIAPRHAETPACTHATTVRVLRIACAIVTGLIYVVIIALWAAVLIPIWLRRHDQISEVRSTARFSSAMKSLGKGGKAAPAGNRMSVLEDPREMARQSAAKRRAIIMGVLSGALALMLLLAVVGLVPRIAPIVMAIIVLSYVLAAAFTSSQRSQRSQAGSARRREGYYDDQYDDYDDDYASDLDYDDYREMAYSDEVADVAYPRSRGVRPQTRRSRDAQVAAAMDDFLSWDPWEGEAETGGDDWSAVPTTLPTYVNAPRATRVRRPIERDRDWSGEAMVEAARTMRRPRVTVDDLTDDKYALESRSAERDLDTTSELPALRPEETRRAAGE